MDVLIYYNSTQTYTNTVYEHLYSLKRFGLLNWQYAHASGHSDVCTSLVNYQAVGIHYSTRLAFDQISPKLKTNLIRFGGLKFVFLQDDYDNTNFSKRLILELGVKLVFTVVPQESIQYVYGDLISLGIRFVSVRTGYFDDKDFLVWETLDPPSRRSLFVGYRSRKLSLRYGKLGREKSDIADLLSLFLKEKGIAFDISSEDSERLYGSSWTDFLRSSRITLGTESGCNIFDWYGILDEVVDREEWILSRLEVDGLMNQISPRIFEAILSRSALALFEGDYSGVLLPWEHYIPIAKDGSNLNVVYEYMSDDVFVDAISQKAFETIRARDDLKWGSFVRNVENEIKSLAASAESSQLVEADRRVTNIPIRAQLNTFDAEESTSRSVYYVSAVESLKHKVGYVYRNPKSFFKYKLKKFFRL